MKRNLTSVIFLWTLTSFTCYSSISVGQKKFGNLPSSQDSTYGYTATNPLLLKKGNPRKSIRNSRMFLSGLKTLDNQTLQLLIRTDVMNPNHKNPKIKITNRLTGMPLNGNLGILDKYVFVTSGTQDTVILYVDIYNKGDIKLPIGLKYEKSVK